MKALEEYKKVITYERKRRELKKSLHEKDDKNRFKTELKVRRQEKRGRGPFLETPDNFSGPVSIFSSSFIYQLMVIIGANLANLVIIGANLAFLNKNSLLTEILLCRDIKIIFSFQ